MFGALFDAHPSGEETIVFDPLLLPERGQRNSRGIQRLEVKLDVSMACTTDIHETGMVLCSSADTSVGIRCQSATVGMKGRE